MTNEPTLADNARALHAAELAELFPALFESSPNRTNLLTLLERRRAAVATAGTKPPRRSGTAPEDAVKVPEPQPRKSLGTRIFSNPFSVPSGSIDWDYSAEMANLRLIKFDQAFDNLVASLREPLALRYGADGSRVRQGQAVLFLPQDTFDFIHNWATDPSLDQEVALFRLEADTDTLRDQVEYGLRFALDAVEKIAGASIDLIAGPRRRQNSPLRPLFESGYEPDDELEYIRAEAESNLTAIRRSTGDVADSVLGQGFTQYGRVEKRYADRLSFGVGVFAILSLFAGVLSFAFFDNTGNVVNSLAHLTVTLPFLAVAGYLARISSIHRGSAQHARLCALQLRTLSAFVADLADEERGEVRMLLARRIFTSPDSHNDGDGTISILPEDLRKLIETVVSERMAK